MVCDLLVSKVYLFWI